MTILNILILLVVVLIPAILVIAVFSRINRNQLRRIQEMKGQDPDFDPTSRFTLEGDAVVLSKNQTIVPNAGGYAKVDLLLEIQVLGKTPYQASTSWLVEVESLIQILAGQRVPIKVDPKKTKRIIPNVPWAKPWIFGK